MNIRPLLKLTSFFFLEAIGIPCNLVILACFAHLRICNVKFIPADSIICNLSFVNLVVVLIPSLPQCLSTLGVLKNFDGLACNFFICMYRICKSTSVCMTSLLSCYQCGVLAPFSSSWKTMKTIVVQKLFLIVTSIWCLNTLISLLTVNFQPWLMQVNSTGNVINFEFCIVRYPSRAVFLVNAVVSTSRDLACICLMSLSSSCIVLVLNRHRKRVKSMWKAERDWRNATETKAAKAVVMLVSMYVFFFGLDSGIWIYSLGASTYVPPELSDALGFFSSCYSALCPIVIITSNKNVHLKLRSMIYQQKAPSEESVVSHIGKS